MSVEAGVNCRSGDVDGQSKPAQRTLSFHACGETRVLAKVEIFLGPAEDELTRFEQISLQGMDRLLFGDLSQDSVMIKTVQGRIDRYGKSGLRLNELAECLPQSQIDTGGSKSVF